MASKAAHYVAHLCEMTPEQAQAVLDLLLSGDLPPLEYGRSLDDWWGAIIKKKRQQVKLELLDLYGPTCECCGERPATDLHEVFERRSSDMTWRQIELFTVENCALVCQECHLGGAVDGQEFKDKVKKRRGEDATADIV